MGYFFDTDDAQRKAFGDQPGGFVDDVNDDDEPARGPLVPFEKNAPKRTDHYGLVAGAKAREMHARLWNPGVVQTGTVSAAPVRPSSHDHCPSECRYRAPHSHINVCEVCGTYGRFSSVHGWWVCQTAECVRAVEQLYSSSRPTVAAPVARPGRFQHVVRRGDLPIIVAQHYGRGRAGALALLAAVNEAVAANEWAGWVEGVRVVLPTAWVDPSKLPPLPAPATSKPGSFIRADAEQLVRAYGARPPEGLDAGGWLGVLRMLAADACEPGAPEDGKGGPSARMWTAEGTARIVLPVYALKRFVHRYDRKAVLAQLWETFPTLATTEGRRSVERWVMAYEGGRAQ